MAFERIADIESVRPKRGANATVARAAAVRSIFEDDFTLNCRQLRIAYSVLKGANCCLPEVGLPHRHRVRSNASFGPPTTLPPRNTLRKKIDDRRFALALALSGSTTFERAGAAGARAHRHQICR